MVILIYKTACFSQRFIVQFWFRWIFPYIILILNIAQSATESWQTIVKCAFSIRDISSQDSIFRNVYPIWSAITIEHVQIDRLNPAWNDFYETQIRALYRTLGKHSLVTSSLLATSSIIEGSIILDCHYGYLKYNGQMASIPRIWNSYANRCSKWLVYNVRVMKQESAGIVVEFILGKVITPFLFLRQRRSEWLFQMVRDPWFQIKNNRESWQCT